MTCVPTWLRSDPPDSRRADVNKQPAKDDRLAQLQQKHELKMVYGRDSEFFKLSIEPGLQRLDEHLHDLPGYAEKTTWLYPLNSDEGTVTISYLRYQSNGRQKDMDLKPPLKLFGPKADAAGPGSPPVIDWKKGFVDGSVVRVQVFPFVVAVLTMG